MKESQLMNETAEMQKTRNSSELSLLLEDSILADEPMNELAYSITTATREREATGGRNREYCQRCSSHLYKWPDVGDDDFQARM